VNNNTSITNYWRKALVNAKYFEVNEKDELVLNFLSDITIEFKEDKKSFTAFFHFKQNPYFDATILEKTYLFNKKEDTYDKCTSPVIEWKDTPPNKKKVTKKIKSTKYFLLYFLN
jgi:hypothetical protein